MLVFMRFPYFLMHTRVESALRFLKLLIFIFHSQYLPVHLITRAYFLLANTDMLSPVKLIKSTAPRNIILGTSSSSRQTIIKAMGFKFNVITADIDERAFGDRSLGEEGARDLVKLLAKKKAEAILAKLTTEQKERGRSRILLTADQVVTHKGKILEKPTTVDEVNDPF